MKNNLKCKIGIQKILSNNITSPTGDFHSSEFDEGSFFIELLNKFKLSPKEKNIDSEILLNGIIKSSTKKVYGRFNSKEFKQDKFIIDLFKKFEIESL